MLSVGIGRAWERRRNAANPAGLLSRGVSRWLTHAFAAVFASVFAAGFVTFFAASASARTLRISEFHVEIDVLPDSSLDVTEIIHVQFEGVREFIARFRWNTPDPAASIIRSS
jgi:hypothetical protein